MTDHEHRPFDIRGAREYFLALGPEGRHHFVVALAWLALMLAFAFTCGIVIGLLI